jgi:hypothetical protein
VVPFEAFPVVPFEAFPVAPVDAFPVAPPAPAFAAGAPDFPVSNRLDCNCVQAEMRVQTLAGDELVVARIGVGGGRGQRHARHEDCDDDSELHYDLAVSDRYVSL